jgi:uncharacterized protein YndB with AHSA1/START domain
MSTPVNPNEAIFTRTFKAPRQMVWEAWTKEENLREWFGPKGSTITHAKMDFRVGGSFHYGMQFGEHPEIWGLWTFREINPPKKLQLIQNFSDKDRNVTSHPMAPTWPNRTLSTTTFEEVAGKTTIQIHWEPFEATAEEIATFNAARPSMNEGWSGTFEQLDIYLAKKQGSGV